MPRGVGRPGKIVYRGVGDQVRPPAIARGHVHGPVWHRGRPHSQNTAPFMDRRADFGLARQLDL